MATCRCTDTGPLCTACSDAETYALWSRAERIAVGWAKRMYRLRPGLPWPAWDEASPRADRMRGRARELVAELHDDPSVLERLARTCGVAAGREYVTPSWLPENRTPRMVAGRGDLKKR